VRELVGILAVGLQVTRVAESQEKPTELLARDAEILRLFHMHRRLQGSPRAGTSSVPQQNLILICCHPHRIIHL